MVFSGVSHRFVLFTYLKFVVFDAIIVWYYPLTFLRTCVRHKGLRKRSVEVRELSPQVFTSSSTSESFFGSYQ